MKKNCIKTTLIVALILGGSYWASAQVLEKMLWENVKKCNEQIAEEGEDYYSKKEVDPKNGYLSVAGGWPTCGCGCEATVAAFKDSKRSYTLVRYEDWNCAQEFGVYTSRNVDDVMPKNFAINAFGKNGKLDYPIDKSYFYLGIELPLHGTDVLVNLKPLPLGMVGKGKNGLSYNTESVTVIDRAAENITSVAKALTSIEELNHLMNGNLNLLPEATQRKINNTLSSYNRSLESFEETLKEAYQSYQIYQQLEFTTAVLGWDRATARFFIKSKNKAPVKMNFLDFLRTATTYLMVC